MTVGPLFEKIMNCKEKIIILQGGGDAGKTVTTLQYLGVMATQDPGAIITVTAQDGPNLKKGAMRSFQNYVAPDLRKHIQSFNQTDRHYTFKQADQKGNKSLIEFSGFQDGQDAAGSERDYLFINECNSRTYEFFWQLQRKTRKKVILDYNPTSKFWVHSKIIDGEERQFQGKWKLFIVDHRHNPFLSQEDHDSYESISDPDMFRVYSRGLTGKIKGLIFGHFQKCDGPPAVYDRIIWGMDYGFTNDQTAIVKMWIAGKKRWAKEICYEPGISEESIKTLMEINGYEHGQAIYGDSANAGNINALRRIGLPVNPAIKGPGCEAARISKVRQHECFYFDSPNFEKELGMYKFVMAQDIVTGKEIMTNQPIKGWDHLCDAFAYADYTDSFRHR